MERRRWDSGGVVAFPGEGGMTEVGDVGVVGGWLAAMAQKGQGVVI